MKANIPSIITAMIALGASALALPMAQNLDEAKVIAKEQKRAILLDLTGKDWCPGCIYLKNKILDSDVMTKAKGDKYVLVEVDYPRDPKKIEAIPAEERAARENILTTYKVPGFPCIIYMDEEGLPYAVYTKYTKTPEEYIETIMNKAEEVRAARDAAFAKASKLNGMDKAKALVAALELLPEVCRIQYKAVLAEIAKLDPENTLGYSRLIEDANKRVAQLNEWEKHIRTFIAGLKGAPAELQNVTLIMEMCEEYLKKPDLIPEVRQKIVVVIADGYAFHKNVPMVYATMHRGLAEDPDAQTEDADKLRKCIAEYDNFILKELNLTEQAHQAAKHYLDKAKEREAKKEAPKSK